MPSMKFRISSQFGALEEVRGGRIHHGIDLAMPKGTELRSVAEGVVERVVDQVGGLGKGVFIRTSDGETHIYGHLDRINVRVGERVDPGELIGLSGNTGLSTGPHLHFGLMRFGTPVDPTPLVDAVQHYSGEIAGPSILGIKGPAMWLIEKATGHAQEQIVASAKSKIMEWLQAVADVIFDFSYGFGLIGCAVLIILGTVGLKEGYRWSGVLFTVCTMLRLVLGGAR